MSDRSEFSIASSSGAYDVVVGTGALAEAVVRSDVFVVDVALELRLREHLDPDARVVALEADEHSKTLAGCERTILALRELGVRRQDRLLAVGGGVVQDVATFVASVYMRGLAWSYAPTTLMAMADSCIGGKSSINVGDVKNLVGNIYPPERVAVDPLFVASLPRPAIAAGLSEAAKICYCRGLDSFGEYLRRFEALDEDPAALIEHTLRAKKWFVEIDEFDRAERRLLNFGHTFAHALEVATEHAISHGLAVAVGVLCASRHPLAARGPDVDRLTDHCRTLLAMAPRTATALASVDLEVFERSFRADKKHSADSFRLILPAAGGGVAEVPVPQGREAMTTVLTVVGDTIEELRSFLAAV